MPNTIGTRQVCRLLDIDKNTLIRWVKAGQVPFVDQLPGANGAYLFDREQMEQFAEDLKVLAAARPPADALPGLEVGR